MRGIGLCALTIYAFVLYSPVSLSLITIVVTFSSFSDSFIARYISLHLLTKTMQQLADPPLAKSSLHKRIFGPNNETLPDECEPGKSAAR